jgi:hypothetical protein
MELKYIGKTLYMKKRHMAKPNDKDVQSVQEE